MAKWLKGVLCGVALVLVSLAIVIGFVVSRFDPNGYKAQLQSEVLRLTGRKLTIEGDIQLQFFPRLEMAVSGVRFDNPTGFSNTLFLKASQAAVAIQLWPLFLGKIEANKITLRGAEINLMTNANGEHNWIFKQAEADVKNISTHAQLNATEAAPAMILPRFSFDTINITSGKLIWDNVPAKQRYQFSNIYFQASNVAPGSAFPIVFSSEVLSVLPVVTGKVRLLAKIDLAANLWQADVSELSFNGHVGKQVLSQKLTGVLSLDPQMTSLSLGSLALEGKPLALSGGLLKKRGSALDFQADRLHLKQANHDWDASDLACSLDFGQNTITLNKLSFKAYEGRGSASGHYVTDTNDFKLQGNLEGIDSAPIFENVGIPAKGRLTAEITLSGRVTNTPANPLMGQARFALTRGALLGIDLPAVVQQAKLLMQKRFPSDTLSTFGNTQSTPFDRFGGSFAIQGGIASTKDLKLETQWMTVFINGQTNFSAQSLQFDILGKPTRENEQAIPLRLKGTYQKPLLLPNLEVLLKQEAKQQLNRFNDHLNKQLEKLGPVGKEVKGALDQLFQ